MHILASSYSNHLLQVLLLLACDVTRPCISRTDYVSLSKSLWKVLRVQWMLHPDVARAPVYEHIRSPKSKSNFWKKGAYVQVDQRQLQTTPQMNSEAFKAMMNLSRFAFIYFEPGFCVGGDQSTLLCPAQLAEAYNPSPFFIENARWNIGQSMTEKKLFDYVRCPSAVIRISLEW